VRRSQGAEAPGHGDLVLAREVLATKEHHLVVEQRPVNQGQVFVVESFSQLDADDLGPGATRHGADPNSTCSPRSRSAPTEVELPRPVPLGGVESPRRVSLGWVCKVVITMVLSCVADSGRVIYD